MFIAEIDPGRWDGTDTSRFWTDRKLDLCNQCHNRHVSTEGVHRYQYDDANNLPYLPGLDLKDFVRHPIRDAQYWDADSISFAHHQTGQDYWRSAHYSEHVFPNGCYDCHDPHSNTEYPYQLDRNWYSLTKGEGCLAFGCHQSFSATEITDGKEMNLHTKHTQDVSQCVNCHYTKVASITLTLDRTFEFSDHSDNVIRPNMTRKGRLTTIAGIPNTCAFSCHRNGYGERNRPDAFDEHVAFRLSTGKIPGRAPDYGIVDQDLKVWNERSDVELADSLWKAYQVMYKEYVTSVRIGASEEEATPTLTISPNPAREDVNIRFALPRTEHVRLEVFNAKGEFVRLIATGVHGAGEYQDMWEGISEIHGPVASGVYIIRLYGETFEISQTVLLQR